MVIPVGFWTTPPPRRGTWWVFWAQNVGLQQCPCETCFQMTKKHSWESKFLFAAFLQLRISSVYIKDNEFLLYFSDVCPDINCRSQYGRINATNLCSVSKCQLHRYAFMGQINSCCFSCCCCCCWLVPVDASQLNLRSWVFHSHIMFTIQLTPWGNLKRPLSARSLIKNSRAAAFNCFANEQIIN